jgi:hypothetical protein
MYIYTPTEDPVFESLRTHIVDKSKLEPINIDCSGKFNPMYGKPQSEYQKQFQSDLMKNKVTVKDKFGNRLRVSKTDPRFLSGDLVGINAGITFSKNKSYTLISPDGLTYSGNFSYIKSIIELNNLSLSTLYRTIKLKRPAIQGKTKGWLLEVFELI